ncbi:MAG: NAD-dependent epimerase/dehydratase family protein [Actinomycetota bacterium]|nr:NAD-dependent epimerase/dehydratase family protein [Actinomycetota bacterium]
MRVVVTGGAGFIGANLCRRLLTEPAVDHVVAVDDLSTGDAANLAGLDVDLVLADISSDDLLDIVRPGDAVVHLAARGSVARSIDDPPATHRVNVAGTVNVAEAVRRRRAAHLVLASSSSVYGSNPELPKHEQLDPRPMSPYAASKLAAEQWALASGNCFDVPTLAFRFFNVYGPLQPAGHVYAAVVPQFIRAAIDGEPVTIYGDGRQSRDFTYVDSVTAVVADAVTRRVATPGPVNLAFGRRADLLEVRAAIAAALGVTPPVEWAEARTGDVRHSQADGRRLGELFPDAAPVPLADGIARTVRWFRTGAVEAPLPIDAVSSVG